MIHKDTFKVVDFNGSKGLVYIGDKILVYRRDYNTPNEPGKIDLPGGGREVNETPFETFYREVCEEFGLNIKKEELVFSCKVKSAIEPNKNSFFIVAKTKNTKIQDIKFGDEGSEWMLITVEEFMNRQDAISRQQERVLKYLDGSLAGQD